MTSGVAWGDAWWMHLRRIGDARVGSHDSGPPMAVQCPGKQYVRRKPLPGGVHALKRRSPLSAVDCRATLPVGIMACWWDGSIGADTARCPIIA